MENATKALLIAAAVLIVILLIAFGMRIFNSTGDASTQAQSTATSTAIQSFNGQFTGYIGKNITGTSIRSLNTAVITSNKVNTSHQVTCTIPTNLDDAKLYTVSATYDTDGYIKTITIN